ncbi:hypothetical protein, partial [Paraburkholderia sp. SIMBA_053]|uniref:hypothetical protein n=1 Tax=Paraburkholderia sp. SIMBA_053 TaxID=3085794 RepID=UPI0039780FAF
LTREKADRLVVFSRTGCSVAGLHAMSAQPEDAGYPWVLLRVDAHRPYPAVGIFSWREFFRRRL